MKTIRALKCSWFPLAVVLAILIGEFIGWERSTQFGLRNNPFLVTVLATGLGAAIASVLFEGTDFK